MREIIPNICIIGIIQPICVTGILVFWTLGLGFFEIIFFWNEPIKDFLIFVRENFHPFRLGEFIPNLIYYMIGWFIISFILLFFFIGKRKKGIGDDLSNIDGEY